MHARLTYLSFLSFAACLVSSCASDAPENNVDVSKGAELSFAVSDASRASDTPPFTKFAVYGDMKFPVDGNAAPTVTFNKTLVEYIDGNWTYEGTQYWFPKHEHSFVAVSPVSVLEAPGAALQYSSSGLSFKYALPVSDGNLIKDGITDILAATHRRLYNREYVAYDTTKNEKIPVILKFQHIMSKVNVSLALADEVMKAGEFVLVHKIEMSGIRTEAAFSLLPASRQSAASQTDDIVIDVNGHAGNAGWTVDFGDAPKKLLNGGTSVTLLTDALIMLPQAFGADSDTGIVVTYTLNGDTEAPKTLLLQFKDTSWDPGKSYNYKAVFSVDKATVRLQVPEITPWESKDLDSEAFSE